MYYYISGKVAAIYPQMAVIDCGGVGYAVNTTNNTLSDLTMGEEGKLFTYCHIREDCFDIYGFSTQSEKHCFELLIAVSGVGPKAALSILSTSTPEALAMSILSEDEKTIMVAQGIGKKIAKRVILELKDKISKENQNLPQGIPGAPGSSAASGGTPGMDAAAALSVLGYSSSDISMAMRDIDPESMPVQEIIRQALKNMVK